MNKFDGFRAIEFALTIIWFNASQIIAQDPLPSPFEMIAGDWLFMENARNLPKNTNCRLSSFDYSLVHNQTLTFSFPNVVNDELGNEGAWTFGGFTTLEVNVASRKYLGWLTFDGHTFTNLSAGFAYDVFARDWSCFKAVKTRGVLPTTQSPLNRKVDTPTDIRHTAGAHVDDAVVTIINSAQTAWVAENYERNHVKDVGQSGAAYGSVSRRFGAHFKDRLEAKASKIENGHVADLPSAFDWRNVNGRNFVSPVRDQGMFMPFCATIGRTSLWFHTYASEDNRGLEIFGGTFCGSCYIFSSLGMLESRIRIASNNTVQPVFSVQDVIDCSNWSDGCHGGWPYHVHGKYAESFGVVDETLNPYLAKPSGHCATPTNARRHYASDYRYIGGFLGASTVEKMMIAIYERGPIVVAIDPFDCQDLAYYRTGIYQPTGVKVNENLFPHDLIAHAVLIVGWGVNDTTSHPYWIVKNSFGTSWGEDGYFRIRRGVDDCSVESMPSEATPLTTY